MFTNILYATDLRPDHEKWLEKAVAIAKKTQAKLSILHVIEIPASFQVAQNLGFSEIVQPAQDDAKAILSVLGENFGIPSAQQFIETGSVKTHILNKATELDCQLIILGNHQPEGMPAFLGNTVHAVLQHAPCNVLVLKDK